MCAARFNRSELKPNLKFDYVPIKEVNVGRENEDWLRTDTFLSIVSKLSKEEDVKKAGGFMVIRPKNYKGAIPFICEKEKHLNASNNYNPRHFDMTDEFSHFLYEIPSLEQVFQAQIHNQRCYQLKQQLFKWNDKQIYNKNKTIKERHEINIKRIINKPIKKRKRGRPRKENNNNHKKGAISFDIIQCENGETMTQTQSGRIIKRSPRKMQQNMFDELDKYLQNEGNETNNDNNDNYNIDNYNNDRKRKREHINNCDTKSPAKKRKLIESSTKSLTNDAKIKVHDNGIFTLHYEDDVDMNEPNEKLTESENETSDTSNNSKGVKYDKNNLCIIKTSNKIPKKRAKPGFKYQYPFQLKPSMPEPDEDDTTEPTKDFKLETRESYKKISNSCSSKPKSTYSYNSGLRKTPKKESISSSKHINRGFACVIEQIEEKKKKAIKHFWDKQQFIQQLTRNQYDEKSPEEVPLIFGDYLASAETVQYAILDSNSVYHFESPLQLSALSRYGPFSALNLDEIMLGIELPYVYIGQQHTFFPFHREDMNLYATNHLLWGCDKLWYCIHPKDHKKVIKFIRKQYCSDIDTPENLRNCQTPLQHKLFWFDPYILLCLGIEVFFIRQKPGDIVITPPGGIHGGLNTGPNMAESINFMTWDIETCWKPVLGAMFYYMHNFDCDVCITHAFLDINRLAQRLRERKELPDNEKKLIPDKSIISEPLPITRISHHFPKYQNEDKYISRSFTWNDRLTLRSRFLNSNEYTLFMDALQRDIIYPCYRIRHNQGIDIYPIQYNGSWQHQPDDLEFIPLYNISYLHDNKWGDQNISLQFILTDHGISQNKWKHKFNEELIKTKLINKLDLDSDNDQIQFNYKKIVKKHKKMKKKKIEMNNLKINSAQRRKKLKRKRVIQDSDTSDSD